MKPYVPLSVLMVGLATFLMAFAPRAHAGVLSLKDGHWRYEIQGMHGTNIGGGDHNDDAAIIGEVEYEIPAYRHWALGLKAIPLFVFDQHGSTEREKSTILGVGGGFVLRVYQHADVRNGLFAEAGISVLWHSPKFEDNSSNINFLNELGIGYQFKNDWHVTAKFEHISNASTASKNAGTNSFGLAVGKTF